jgi:NTE family protein
MGGAWLVGALDALAGETGWDPGGADRVVGTSAGSMIAALLGSGVPPWFMRAHSSGESFEGLVDAEGRPAAEADRAAGAVFRLHRGLPPLPGPGSLPMAVRTLLDPRRHAPTALAAGWIPAGLISTQPLRDTVRRVVPFGWSPHPGLWVVACDYSNGRRTVFGRDAEGDLADAVAASCAIPGFYRPVRIHGRRYVDGGVCSASNADVLRREGLDLAIVLNPLSGRTGIAGRLRREARKLLEAGTDVLLIEPRGELRGNLMARGRRNEVMDAAHRTVSEQLRDRRVRAQLSDLPSGPELAIRRPATPPAAWGTLRDDVLATRLAA